jgi:Mg/Co/Ni transporter MgtE
MKTIKNTKPRVHHVGEELTLLPGHNLLDSPAKLKAWAEAKKIKVVQHHLEEGDLEEIESSLQELTGAAAVKFVQETNDGDALDALGENETRKEVIEAIDAQLAKLAPTAEQIKAREGKAEKAKK